MYILISIWARALSAEPRDPLHRRLGNRSLPANPGFLRYDGHSRGRRFAGFSSERKNEPSFAQESHSPLRGKSHGSPDSWAAIEFSIAQSCDVCHASDAPGKRKTMMKF